MSSERVEVPSDFGVDLGGVDSIAESLKWAAENDIRYVDVRLTDRIHPDEYEDAEIERIRRLCDDRDISLGLHTLSAINPAEFTPIVEDAVRQYLRSYVDMAAELDVDRTIVHAGYHFTADEDERRAVSLRRLEETIDYAAEGDVNIHLENMNPEPADAEVHYLCSELSEVQRYFDSLASSNLRMAFNPPHAHLHEEGVDGYIDVLNLDICEEVRLNDNRGVREEHLMPGEGTINFEQMFEHLESLGYDGPYTVALGSRSDSLAGIQQLQAKR